MTESEKHIGLLFTAELQFRLAVAVKDAIRAVVSDPKASADSEVRAAYQIARLIRNAFAHAPFSPIWSIDPDCRSTQFEIADVIRLDTTDLHGKAFDWRHYGGPLALYRLAQFTRIQVLKDDPPPRKILLKDLADSDNRGLPAGESDSSKSGRNSSRCCTCRRRAAAGWPHSSGRRTFPRSQG
mgnify:CR=1 FL=1